MNQYLTNHPNITQFSTLVRAALWEKLDREVTHEEPRPSFLWDYDLSSGEIHEIINGPQPHRLWLVAKILEHAYWNEIWRFLTRCQIEQDLPLLRLHPKTRRHWVEALRTWRQ